MYVELDAIYRCYFRVLLFPFLDQMTAEVVESARFRVSVFHPSLEALRG